MAWGGSVCDIDIHRYKNWPISILYRSLMARGRFHYFQIAITMLGCGTNPNRFGLNLKKERLA